MSMIEVGSIFVGSSISVILASLGLGAMALAWGVLGQQFTRGVIAQLRNGFLLPWPFNLKCVKPILYFGRGNSLLNLNGAISQRTPELIIGSFLSVTAVGLYSRAIGLVIQLRALASGAVASAFYPAFARVHGSGAPLGDPYIRVVAAYSAVSWPALTALAVAAEPLVLLLYGERWLGTVTLVKWLALSELCLVSLPLHVELPMLLGHFRLLLICNYIETIVAVGLLFLASTMGLEWVAISRLAYSLIWYVIYFPFLYNIIKFDLIALLGVYFRSMIATIAAVIPLLLSYHFWRTPDELGFSGLLACTVAGIVCWALTLFIFRHPTGSEILALLNDLMIKYSK
jgi:O-antigen/teichoic acid export membrane protein